MYSRILVPIDGSETSAQGLREATKLAKALGSSIRLIHIIDSMSMLSATTGVADYASIAESLRQAAELMLAETADQVKKEGVENVLTTLVEAGSMATGECVVQKAQEHNAELIVCGTHGRRGLERLLIGSDAEYIVRHANVPVLLIRVHAQN